MDRDRDLTLRARRRNRFKVLAFSVASVLAVFFSVAKGPNLAKQIGNVMRLEQVEWEEVGSTNLSKLVTKDMLRKAGELTKGEEMLPIDLGELETKLRAVPWIESVYIQKKLPSTLYIRYTTHNARAIALRKGKLWTLSSAGQWIAPLGKLHLDLPVIISGAQSDQVALALKWLETLETGFKNQIPQVHELNISGDKFTKISVLVDLKYPSTTTKITLRALEEPTPESLARLKRVVQYLIKNNILVSTIDLRTSKKVVVNVGRKP